MARKNPPQNPQPAQLTAEERRAAIPKLKRRIEELNSFDPNSINDRSDPRSEFRGQYTSIGNGPGECRRPRSRLDPSCEIEVCLGGEKVVSKRR